MHNILASILIITTGWTLSSNVVVLSGQSLQTLLIVAPFAICGIGLIYYYLTKIIYNEHAYGVSIHNSNGLIDENKTSIIIGGLFVLPVVLYVSWTAFWAASVAILTYCIFRRGGCTAPTADEAGKPTRWEWMAVLCLAAAAVVVTLLVSRSDLDDAFYVAIAATASGNPDSPLLASDPMHGDTNLPLIFPSYRLASFELLGGAAAYLLGIPAMDAMYKLFPPVWAVVSVFCIFLLAQEYLPKRWLLVGVVTLTLIVVLGESHRAPANMMFVRMFQGKAVFLSVIVPAIFYLTARYFSRRGTSADLFLLGCCQVAAVGLSNFGMLAAPVAGLGAVLSNIPVAERPPGRRILKALVTLTIPLPYLLAVAAESNWGSAMMQFQNETASQVWRSVFGVRQQFLVAVLLLVGPVMARDAITRWRLAVPPLLLFAIYLNPWLASFISNNITTPPVYWRVVWSFPILIFAAISVCIVIDRLLDKNQKRFFPAILSAMVAILFLVALPLNTLRADNIGRLQGFAGRKVDIDDYMVAVKSIQINGNEHRLLAPDHIAGLVSRFEVHPKLANVRGLYLDILAPALGPDIYRQRRILRDLVSGGAADDDELVSTALISLDVSTIVIRQNYESSGIVEMLKRENYQMVESINGHSIWRKDFR